MVAMQASHAEFQPWNSSWISELKSVLVFLQQDGEGEDPGGVQDPCGPASLEHTVSSYDEVEIRNYLKSVLWSHTCTVVLKRLETYTHMSSGGRVIIIIIIIFKLKNEIFKRWYKIS